MSNYYYIVSSLPVLKLDQKASEEELDQAWSLIQRNANAKDLLEIEWFLKRNDLYNLLENWQHHYLGYPFRPLRKPYSLKEEAITSSTKDPEILDPLWQEFYWQHKADLPLWTANEMDSKGFTFFFDKVASEAHPYIQQLFAFESMSRSLMATFNTGIYPFANKEFRYGSSSLYRQLLQGKSQLSEKQKLSTPHLDLLLKALSQKDPAAITNAVHKVLWDKADELARGHYFDQIALLNYCFKIFLTYRREQLDSNKQKPFLADLLEESLKKINHHD